MELAYAFQTAPGAWAAEDDATLATAVAVLEEVNRRGARTHD